MALRQRRASRVARRLGARPSIEICMQIHYIGGRDKQNSLRERLFWEAGVGNGRDLRALWVIHVTSGD